MLCLAMEMNGGVEYVGVRPLFTGLMHDPRGVLIAGGDATFQPTPIDSLSTRALISYVISFL
jgi:hypothetical protein